MSHFRNPVIARPMGTILAISLLLLPVVAGCTGQPETVEPETIEVEVTREVPVTVETVRNVEVTRQVMATQQVPVTVVVPQTVEVTREVAVPQTVEVTRQAPVTRSAATATPVPSITPTATPADTAAETPTPAATPAAAPTPTPVPPATTRFGSWMLDEQQHYGDREVHRFWNEALHQTGTQPPTLTYQCDTRGGRTMYIDWQGPVTAQASDRPSSSRDPFSQYRDVPHYALLEYAAGLLEFVDGLQLTSREQDDFDEIWERVEKRWFIGQGAQEFESDPAPDTLVAQLRDRTHRSVRILLAFYQEFIDPEKETKYGPPSLADIEGEWIVLSDRTQINPGAMGELRPAVRGLYSVPFNKSQKRVVMTATISEPGQPTVAVAKWDVDGIRLVTSHCEALRPF
ncbi:MAG: hypothetical protein OXF79_20870 [Chloroflexi bacterium]|nr:hypothetical protein [Chloroflexota bacterium]